MHKRQRQVHLGRAVRALRRSFWQQTTLNPALLQPDPNLGLEVLPRLGRSVPGKTARPAVRGAGPASASRRSASPASRRRARNVHGPCPAPRPLQLRALRREAAQGAGALGVQGNRLGRQERGYADPSAISWPCPAVVAHHGRSGSAHPAQTSPNGSSPAATKDGTAAGDAASGTGAHRGPRPLLRPVAVDRQYVRSDAPPCGYACAERQAGKRAPCSQSSRSGMTAVFKPPGANGGRPAP